MYARKIALLLLIAVAMQLIGCTGGGEDIYNKSTSEIVTENINLDAKTQKLIESLTPRKFIQLTHSYMNYLWTYKNGKDVSGNYEEVLEALSKKWDTYDFSKENTNVQKMDELITKVMSDVNQFDTNKNRLTAHRVFHQLDYYVLEETKAPGNAVRYDKYVDIKLGALKDWGK